MYDIGIIVSYVITVLGWISLILGLILRKLPGLESMLVLQYSWLPILFINSPLHPPLQSIYPLHYTSFYNHRLFTDS